MTDNIPVRAATSGDLVNFRSENQGIKLGLAIKHGETVFTARVNQDFASHDGIIEIAYNDSTGDIADVLSGMTMYIGSAAGLRDKGIVRIRKSPTDAKLFTGQTSNIYYSIGDYLTVVNDMSLWQREINQNGNVISMDSDIEYSLRGGSAIIRAAPMVAIIKMVAGVATFTPPSPALSVCYDGETIVSYQYDAPGAATTANMTSGTGAASWTYDIAGQYRWSLTVTDSNSKTTITHRWVFVDNVSPDFVLSSNPTGSAADGGWSFGITMYDDATLSDIADRAMVVLYADAEYFGGVEKTIGKLAGYENIIAVGWIDGESIVRDSQLSEVSFSVHGAAHWLNKIRASALGIEYTSTTPASWSQIEGMTVDKALAHILHWTTTAPLIMDCFFSGDETIFELLTQPSGSVLNQIQNVALNNIFASPIVNNLGQMFIQIDAQMMTPVQRAALVSVMTVTTGDYEGSLELERNTSGAAAMIELQCNTFDGNATTALYSRAPGNVGGVYGSIDAPSNYIAVDQDETNRLAGCLLAIGNMPYESIDITLAMQNRLIDISPMQYCQISVAAGDNPRGISLTNQNLIPRSVSYNFADGYFKTEVSFELASSPVDGIPYYPPLPVDQTLDDEIYNSEWDGATGDFGGFSGVGSFPTSNITYPDTTPALIVTPADCKTETGIVAAPANEFALVFDKKSLTGADVALADRTTYAYCPCTIRKAGSTYLTSVYIFGVFKGITPATVHVYGIKNNTIVATATCTVALLGINATFAPVAAVPVDGFRLVIDYGAGVFTAGATVSSGTVLATNDAGVALPVNVGDWYAIEGSGGPWLFQASQPSYLFYNFAVSLDGITWSSRQYTEGVGLSNGDFRLDLGSVLAFAESIGSLYGRAFFQATGALCYFAVSDSLFTDNAGTLGYTLKEATADVRTALITLAQLKNVCAV